MLNLNSVMLGTSNPKALALFYEKLLEKKPDIVDGDWCGFSAGSCFISIGSHDKVKGNATNPERIMLNFETSEVEKEFQRIEALGATVVAKPYHPNGDASVTIATLADPDGNFFQLMTPWEPEK